MRCCLIRTTPSHAVRCVLGTALRLAVWGSVLNLGLSVAGKTRGFWATKVVNASVRTSRKLLASRFNLKETYAEFRHASREVHTAWAAPTACSPTPRGNNIAVRRRHLDGCERLSGRMWRLGTRQLRRRASTACRCWTSCRRGELSDS